MDGKPKPRLLDQVRNRLRYLHYSPKTEQSYIQWIRRYILFHNKQHPATLGPESVTEYLNFLSNHKRVAASTQNLVLIVLRLTMNVELLLDLPVISALIPAFSQREKV